MATLTLTAGQSIATTISQNQSIQVWSNGASAAQVVSTDTNTNRTQTDIYGPQPFRITLGVAPFAGTIKINCLTGSISYAINGAMDKNNLQTQSIRSTVTETLMDFDADADVVFTAGGATTATIANNVPAGWGVNCYQRGGIVSFVVTGGSLTNRSSFTKTGGTNAKVRLDCVSNTGTSPQIVLSGDGQV